MARLDVIFLDMDEVLTQWVAAALELLSIDIDDACQQWDNCDPRPWDVFDVLDVSMDQVWRRIDEAGEDFWATLKPYPWWRSLYDACADVAPTMLLTSPSLHPSCAAGKTRWIQHHFGRQFRDFFIGHPKQWTAHPGALLIDDSPKNCHKFAQRGGRSILFPSFGNALHMYRHDPLPLVYAELFA